MTVEYPMPMPLNETDRVIDMRSLGILDTPPEEPFDGIVEVAAALFEVPVALLTLVDVDDQWFKASVGVSFSTTPRALAFCNETITNERTTVYDDLSKDANSAAHPFVAGEPHVRFYAGTPLISDRGLAVGTLCLLDVKPRSFDSARYRLLERLARQAMDAIETRRLVSHLLDVCIASERVSLTKAQKVGLA